MNDVVIVPLDPYNPDQVQSWITSSQETDATDYPYVPPISSIAMRSRIHSPDSQSWLQRFVALDNSSQVVGTVTTQQDLLNNTDKAFLKTRVHPDYRRRGIGTRLYRVAQDSLRKAGISTVISGYGDEFQGFPNYGDQSPDIEEFAIHPDHGKPGREFARQHGFTIGTQNWWRICDLSSLDHEHLGERDRQLEPTQSDYGLTRYSRFINDDDVEQYCRLRALTLADAPSGGLELDGMKYSVDQWRSREKHAVDGGLLCLGVYARHRRTGVVAGLSEIEVHPGHEFIANQLDTVVDPEHRGRKLGLRLKIAIMRYLRLWRPQVRFIQTFNDCDNHAMVAVNDQVGYQNYCTMVAVQKTLT